MLCIASHTVIVFPNLKKGLSNFWPIAFWVAAVLWFLVLWKLSSTPGSSFPVLRFPNADKVVHFTYFFIGGTIMANALRLSTRLPMWAIFGIVLLIVAAIGLQDEWHQTTTPGRSGNDRGDLLADCMGGGMAALLVACWYGRKKS